MAGISTAIEIQDRVSGALNRITASLYNTTSAFDSLDKASEVSFNPSGVQAVTNEMYKYEDIIHQLESDIVDVNRRFEQMQDEVNETKASVGGLESAVGKIGQVVAGLGLGIIVKQQVTEAIGYASDLSEVQNVVDVVYGEASESVNDWAKTTLDAFGLNELSAKRYVGTMGAMLTSSGMTGDKVQEMSMKITELAGDMASFYNLDAEETFNKIRSGISGETEPLKQLGINMSVANLEAYALAQGIETSYSEMTQAEQTLLRYNYLLQATENAQGDFTDTSHSFSNQTKLLKENWTAFTGELASKALPVLSKGIGLLNDGVTFISDNWTVIQPILLGLLAMIGAYTAALLICKAVQLGAAVATGIHTMVTTTWSAATFAQTVAQNGLNAALLACPITWIILLVIALIAVIIAVCNWIAKTTNVTETGIGIITGALMVAVAFIYNLFIGLLDLVLGIINLFINRFIAFANFFGNLFNDPIGSIIHLFGDMADNILGVIETIAKALDKVFGSKLADTVSGWRDDLDTTIELTANEYGNGSYEKLLEESSLSSESLGFERMDYGDAFDSGSAWGDGLVSGLSNMFSDEETDDAYKDTGAGSLLDATNTIADNTGETIDISSENLKYLRDIAEQEAVNQFTTAEIKVDMQNNNNINNSMDIDGIIEQLTTGVEEAMIVAAEGVH